jgi:hypothetical protein
MCEKSGSHCGECNYDSLLAYSAVLSRESRPTYCLYHLDDRRNDGGITYLWNVGLLQRDYTALFHRRYIKIRSNFDQNFKSYEMAQRKIIFRWTISKKLYNLCKKCTEHKTRVSFQSTALVPKSFRSSKYLARNARQARRNT